MASSIEYTTSSPTIELVPAILSRVPCSSMDEGDWHHMSIPGYCYVISYMAVLLCRLAGLHELAATLERGRFVLDGRACHTQAEPCIGGWCMSYINVCNSVTISYQLPGDMPYPAARFGVRLNDLQLPHTPSKGGFLPKAVCIYVGVLNISSMLNTGA